MGFFDDLWDVIKEVAPVVGTIIWGPEGALIDTITKALTSSSNNTVSGTAPAIDASTEDAKDALTALISSDAGKAFLAKLEAELQDEIKALTDKVATAFIEGIKKL